MLSDLLDIFTCCLFTGSAFTTMLPAFLLAGAITAFVPAGAVVRHLGPKSNRVMAYRHRGRGFNIQSIGYWCR